MKDLYSEKVRVVADRNGWSLTHAKGYVDGDIARRRGAAPSRYAQVGIDDYSLGFRAGYYVRKMPDQIDGDAAAPYGRRRDRASRRPSEH